ncbi:ABC transporter substrate-binding protein [Pseudochrobactrum sp. MP213Fo]|uniref:ABC transporter substrate-binding protein n=1 Tax=Pseudochrobactrum sp. MP213Fo TaxID=3022250 RepID=UPI003B9EE175
MKITLLLTSTCLATMLASPAAAQQTLTIATYGGEWGAAMQACIIDPFTKETGIRVIPEPGISGVTLSKLRQQKDSPTLDVVWLDGGVSEVAAKDNLLHPLTADALPNLNQLLPEAVYKDEDDAIFALGTGFYSLGLAYNTEQVKLAPSSWLDMRNPDYAGSITFPSPANAMGVPFLAQLAELDGHTLTDMDTTFNDLKKLNVVSYFDTAGAGTNLFQSREAVIGAHYSNSTYAMSDQKLPIAFVVPKEGAIGGDIRLHVVSNGKKIAEAEQFVNFAVGVTPSECMAERIYVGPSNSKAVISDEALKRMPWGEDGSIKNLNLPNWNNINENRAMIIEKFNKLVIAK